MFSSSKENVVIEPTVAPPSPPKKKTVAESRRNHDEDDDDFISMRKPAKIMKSMVIDVRVARVDPVKECLDSMILHIENEDATCPICNRLLSNLATLDERQHHVNRCLEESQINHVGHYPPPAFRSHSLRH